MSKVVSISRGALRRVDLSKACINLGVALPNGERAPWLQLDEQDWRILHALLTKCVTSNKLDPDATNATSLRIIDASTALRRLDDFATAAIAWLERNDGVDD